MEIKTKQMGMYTACSQLVQKSYKQTFEPFISTYK